MILKYKQISKKISCSNDKEFVQKLNILNAAGDMDMTIRPTTPNATDTKQWYLVNYWVDQI